MDIAYIESVTEKWENKTNQILKLVEIPVAELQELFRETYKILSFYSHENTVPKSICKLLFSMHNFLVFMGEISEAENMEIEKHFQLFYCLFETLQKDFLNDSFKAAYPKLFLEYNHSKNTPFNFELDHLENL